MKKGPSTSQVTEKAIVTSLHPMQLQRKPLQHSSLIIVVSEPIAHNPENRKTIQDSMSQNEIFDIFPVNSVDKMNLLDPGKTSRHRVI